MKQIKSFTNKLFGGVHVSMMRVLAFLVVIDIMAVWTATCVKDMIVNTADMSLNDIPWGVVSVISIMIIGKVTQRFGEGKNQSPETKKEVN
jgi:hypothetical protein